MSGVRSAGLGLVASSTSFLSGLRTCGSSAARSRPRSRRSRSISSPGAVAGNWPPVRMKKASAPRPKTSMRTGSCGRRPSGAANSRAVSPGAEAIKDSEPEESRLTAVSGLAGSIPALSQSVT